MNRWLRVPGLVLLPIAAAVAASACGGSGDAADEHARPNGAMLEDSVRADSAADDADDAAALGTGNDPFMGFELDAESAANDVERRIALLLRNQGSRTAIVYADGGAGELLLDSVPPGADARVDILSRAATIVLRSVSPEGGLLRTTRLHPGPDTIVDVIVGPPSTP